MSAAVKIREVDYHFSWSKKKSRALWKTACRYIILTGGRSSGKSWTAAMLLLMWGYERKETIWCFRKHEVSLAKSVYPLLVEINAKYSMGYEVFKSKLVHPRTGTVIGFHGISSSTGTMQDVKGLHGTTIAYVEEGAVLSRDEWDFLTPTIREQGSRIIVTMNPTDVNNHIWKLAHSGRDDVFHLHTTYFDNLELSDTARTDADNMKEDDPEYYDHIYMGVPHDDAEVRYVVAPGAWVDCLTRDAWEQMSKCRTGKPHAGLDCADTGTWALVVRDGPLIIHAEAFKASDGDDAIARVHTECVRLGVEQLYFDRTGVGADARTSLKRRKFTPYRWKGIGFGHAPESAEREYQQGVTNAAFFANRAAQLAWAFRRRAGRTRALLAGKPGIEPAACLAVDPELKVIKRFSAHVTRPVWEENSQGKVVVRKNPTKDESLSPHLSDAAWLAFAYDSRFGLTARR